MKWFISKLLTEACSNLTACGITIELLKMLMSIPTPRDSDIIDSNGKKHGFKDFERQVYLLSPI